MIDGNGYSPLIAFQDPPSRVVSLAPGITESMFSIDAHQYLVGISDLCPVPPEFDQDLPRVGMKRSVNISKIIDLRPNLVIAQLDITQAEGVKALEEAKIRVWLILPKSVEEALNVLWTLVRLFQVEPMSTPKIRTLEVTFEWTARAAEGRQLLNVFCPIGMDHSESSNRWVTFPRNTYAHDLLLNCGGLNIFSDRLSTTPDAEESLSSDLEVISSTTEPFIHVSDEEVVALEPEIILIPDDDITFGKVDQAVVLQSFGKTSAVRNQRVHSVDGRFLIWPGTRLAQALGELPSLLQA